MSATAVVNAGHSGGSVPASSLLRSLAWYVLYMLSSISMIRMNKFFMQKGKFPFPLALGCLHMCTTFLMCLVLYACQPSLFPGVRAFEGRRLDMFKLFIPLGTFFAVTLYTTNRAMIYCDASFLQFMKEANVIMSFLMMCSVGLQDMDRVKLSIVMWVVASSAVAVFEEMNFVWIGFLLQAVGLFAECCRMVMGECVLTGAGLRLDPLSYTLYTAPVCMVVLLVGALVTWDHSIWAQAAANWHVLLPSVVLAFVLNVVGALILKENSAVGMCMAGVVKDIFIVLISATAFGEAVNLKQVVGFALTILGIALWTLLKVRPNNPLINSLYQTLGADRGLHELGSQSEAKTGLSKAEHPRSQ